MSMSATLHIQNEKHLDMCVFENHLIIGAEFGDSVYVFASPEQMLEMAYKIIEKHGHQHENPDQQQILNHEHDEQIRLGAAS